MGCKAFHHWLRTRDFKNAPDSREAFVHRSECIECQKLYALDTQAEQGIAMAFAGHEIPGDLEARIDRYLDSEGDPSFLSPDLIKPDF
jgi:hypothetical protein